MIFFIQFTDLTAFGGSSRSLTTTSLVGEIKERESTHDGNDNVSAASGANGVEHGVGAGGQRSVMIASHCEYTYLCLLYLAF